MPAAIHLDSRLKSVSDWRKVWPSSMATSHPCTLAWALTLEWTTRSLSRMGARSRRTYQALKITSLTSVPKQLTSPKHMKDSGSLGRWTRRFLTRSRHQFHLRPERKVQVAVRPTKPPQTQLPSRPKRPRLMNPKLH